MTDLKRIETEYEVSGAVAAQLKPVLDLVAAIVGGNLSAGFVAMVDVDGGVHRSLVVAGTTTDPEGLSADAQAGHIQSLQKLVRQTVSALGGSQQEGS